LDLDQLTAPRAGSADGSSIEPPEGVNSSRRGREDMRFRRVRARISFVNGIPRARRVASRQSGGKDLRAGSVVRGTMVLRIAVAAVIVALPAREAGACKYDGGPVSPAAAMASADLVFEGRPIARHATQLDVGFGDENGFFPAWSYEFVVDRLWKGEARPRVFVAVDYTDCGFSYRRGESTVVYAQRDEDGQYRNNRLRLPSEGGVEGLGRPKLEASPRMSLAADFDRTWPSDRPEIRLPPDRASRRHEHGEGDLAIIAAGLVLAVASTGRRRTPDYGLPGSRWLRANAPKRPPG
jgi:hypothetical protein